MGEDEREALLRYNNYRDKTFKQKMGEGDEYFIIESEASDQRMKNPNQNCGQGIKNPTDTNVADKIDIGSRENYRKAKKVWDAAQDGDEFAQSLVDDLDSEDESMSGVNGPTICFNQL